MRRIALAALSALLLAPTACVEFVPKLCTPGVARCGDSATILVCSADGQELLASGSCSDGTVCLEGVCTSDDDASTGGGPRSTSDTPGSEGADAGSGVSDDSTGDETDGPLEPCAGQAVGTPCPGGLCDGVSSACTPSPCVAYASDADTVGLWHLDDSGGATLVDVAGGLHAQPQGAAARIPGKMGHGLALAADAPEGRGHAATGVSASLDVDTGGDFTLEVWLRTPPLDAGDETVVSLGAFGAADEGGVAIEVVPAGTVRATVAAGEASVELPSAVQVDDGAWHHVGLRRFDGYNIELYVDHELEHAESLGAALVLERGLRIGRRWSVTFQAERPFGGDVDEVRWSRVARNPSAFHGCHCQPGSVEVANRACVDTVEASVGEDKTCTGTLFGVEEDDYPVPDTGVSGTIYACPLDGVVPARFITAAQAARACQLSGRRLCRADEWTAACRGPDDADHPWTEGLDDATCGGSGVVIETGTAPACASALGLMDLAGNVAEWVDSGTDAWQALGGSALDQAAERGCPPGVPGLAAEAPTVSFDDVGFRCCADPEPGLPDG